MINKNTDVSVLELSVRASNYLKCLNIKTLGELTALKSLENPFVYISRSKAEIQIVEALEKLGLRLGMTEDDWNSYTCKDDSQEK